MKSPHIPVRPPIRRSGPARDLWIEIGLRSDTYSKRTSGPARDLWIEIKIVELAKLFGTSGPARDLWIEILICRDRAIVNDGRVPQGTCGLK